MLSIAKFCFIIVYLTNTQGYGSTYPALGNENESPTNCLLITAICSLESFIGVLYSGMLLVRR